MQLYATIYTTQIPVPLRSDRQGRARGGAEERVTGCAAKKLGHTVVTRFFGHAFRNFQEEKRQLFGCKTARLEVNTCEGGSLCGEFRRVH